MIIGIDLGTTNSTLSVAREPFTIETCPLLQFGNEGIEQEFTYLPSFYFFPLPDEQKEPFVGVFAKKRGSELPDRVIASAKSWACHHMANNREPFLPLGCLQEKKSPLEVLSAYLSQIKISWEKKFLNEIFNQQEILITVPASFDLAARSLILAAAEHAGYPEITLIEEPLAAFYSWLSKNEKTWRNHLKVDDVVLVIDIGGGTTDFSLIAVTEKEGLLTLERKAVGEHLLLGGDNIDLTLAYYVQNKWGVELDFIQFQALVHKCREAKEMLLAENPVDKWEIVLQGRGSRLLGGGRSLILTKEEVEELLVEGFFPEVALDESVQESNFTSLSEFGLPYVKDPRVTAQLGFFLKRSNLFPNKVLFNGGTLKALGFQKRLLAVLKKWRGGAVELLDDADLDFAVSGGAAYYGWTKRHDGIKVRAGTTRSYFIGVESSLPAVPGIQPPIKAICIAPLGMEEGQEGVLENQKFSLQLGTKASFRFFSSPAGGKAIGERAQLAELCELKPIVALLDPQGLSETHVLIHLKAKVTEMGMLEIWCQSKEGQKWKLEFDIRKDVT